MKTLSALAIFLVVSSAHASYFHDKCSNASGSVKWESGHNSNSMTLEYYDNQGRQTMNVRLNEVLIKMGDMTTIRDERVNDCAVSRIASSTTVTAGKVTITASEDAPGSLDNIYEKKIETEVICERHFNSMMYCPENN